MSFLFPGISEQFECSRDALQFSLNSDAQRYKFCHACLRHGLASLSLIFTNLDNNLQGRSWMQGLAPDGLEPRGGVLAAALHGNYAVTTRIEAPVTWNSPGGNFP